MNITDFTLATSSMEDHRPEGGNPGDNDSMKQ